MGDTRRAFELLREDARLLQWQGLSWETVIEGQTRWLLIRKFSLPDGYVQKDVDVGLQMPTLYPDQQLDMAWFLPALELGTRRAITNLSSVSIEGVSWQGWSRHRTSENPWRPGVDDISTHLAFVRAWLETETRRN